MISSSFPAHSAQLTSISLKDKIINKFPSVFQDSLTEVPMHTDPVHIHLKYDAIPFRVSAARQIPLHFREPADAGIQELIKKKVLAPCHIPTEWCSPPFFLLKSGGKSVRMITDYTRLNAHVS